MYMDFNTKQSGDLEIFNQFQTYQYTHQAFIYDMLRISLRSMVNEFMHYIMLFLNTWD